MGYGRFYLTYLNRIYNIGSGLPQSVTWLDSLVTITSGIRL